MTGGRRWEKGGVEGRKRKKEDDRRGKNKGEEKREKRRLKREDGSQAQEKGDRKLNGRWVSKRRWETGDRMYARKTINT